MECDPKTIKGRDKNGKRENKRKQDKQNLLEEDQEEQSVGITKDHILEIKEYLRALDLIVDCPIEIAGPEVTPLEHVLFTQPGMRYCQAQALVHSLMKDKTFLMLSEQKKQMITDRILEEVHGRMMEDMLSIEDRIS